MRRLLLLSLGLLLIATLDASSGTSDSTVLLQRGDRANKDNATGFEVGEAGGGGGVGTNTTIISRLEWGIDLELLSLAANTNIEWTLTLPPLHSVHCRLSNNNNNNNPTAITTDVDLALYQDPTDILCASTNVDSNEECTFDGFLVDNNLTIALAVFDDVVTRALVLHCDQEPIPMVQINQTSNYFGLATGGYHYELLNVSSLENKEETTLQCSVSPHYFVAEYFNTLPRWRTWEARFIHNNTTNNTAQTTELSESWSLGAGGLIGSIPPDVSSIMITFYRRAVLPTQPMLKLCFRCQLVDDNEDLLQQLGADDDESATEEEEAEEIIPLQSATSMNGVNVVDQEKNMQTQDSSANHSDDDDDNGGMPLWLLILIILLSMLCCFCLLFVALYKYYNLVQIPNDNKDDENGDDDNDDDDDETNSENPRTNDEEDDNDEEGFVYDFLIPPPTSQ